jgi:hypothetical protein
MNILEEIRSLVIIKQENQPKPGCVRVFSGYCSTGSSVEICDEVADLMDINF